MLVVVCGVPGVGKTSVAEYAATQLDAELVRTDVVRKDIIDDPEYTDEEADRVYGELLARAERFVERDGVVVLDGTFHDRSFRERTLATADELDADYRFLEVECDPSIARERIRERVGDESDADVEVHDMFRDIYDPLDVEHDTVDNSGSLGATHRQVDETLGTTPALSADGGGRWSTGP